VNHFLNIQQLSIKEALDWIQRAVELKKSSMLPRFEQSTLANLFYENSTRTRVSFELAAKRMGMIVINLDISKSSESKGEEIRDTIKTLASMGVDVAVIRHVDEGLPHTMADCAPIGLHVINAGDGTHAHPTQAMLDMMTILEKKPAYQDLKIAIIGNLKHSRVANSFQSMCQLLGVGCLKLVAPEPWLPAHPIYGEMTTSLQEGLTDADVVMTLRIQRERFLASDELDLSDYQRDYRITTKNLTLAKPDAIVMHPGPINRNIEIESDVADGSQSCIWQQVQNGVWIRMAIIEHLLTSSHAK
jgi:aspartate carbamoyltransferase catalytic subunit